MNNELNTPPADAVEKVPNHRLYYAEAVFFVWVGFIFFYQPNILELAFGSGSAIYLASRTFIILSRIDSILGTLTAIALLYSWKPFQNFLSGKDTNSKIAIIIVCLIPAFFAQLVIGYIPQTVAAMASWIPFLTSVLCISCIFLAWKFFNKGWKARKALSVK